MERCLAISHCVPSLCNIGPTLCCLSLIKCLHYIYPALSKLLALLLLDRLYMANIQMASKMIAIRTTTATTITQVARPSVGSVSLPMQSVIIVI